MRYRLIKLLLPLVFVGCRQLNDERLPAYPVNIEISDQGMWNAFGVTGFGDYRYFIREERLPSGFPFSYNTATGYGGVLLIGGLNLETGDVGPLAYDMACPVERQPDIRVYIDPLSEIYEAVCQECQSHYNVVGGVGAPTSGPAYHMKYALTPYECYPTVNGGYIISR